MPLSNAHQLYNMVKVSSSKEDFKSNSNVFLPLVYYSSHFLDESDELLTLHLMVDGSCFIEKNGVLQIIPLGELEPFVAEQAVNDYPYLQKLQKTIQVLTEKYSSLVPNAEESPLSVEQKEELLCKIFDTYSTL